MKNPKQKWIQVIELAQKVNKIAKEEIVTINGIELNEICAVMTDNGDCNYLYHEGEYVEIDEIDTDDYNLIAALQVFAGKSNYDYIRITKSDIEQAMVVLTNLSSDAPEKELESLSSCK